MAHRTYGAYNATSRLLIGFTVFGSDRCAFLLVLGASWCTALGAHFPVTEGGDDCLSLKIRVNDDNAFVHHEAHAQNVDGRYGYVDSFYLSL